MSILTIVIIFMTFSSVGFWGFMFLGRLYSELVAERIHTNEFVKSLFDMAIRAQEDKYRRFYVRAIRGSRYF